MMKAKFHMKAMRYGDVLVTIRKYSESNNSEKLNKQTGKKEEKKATDQRL